MNSFGCIRTWVLGTSFDCRDHAMAARNTELPRFAATVFQSTFVLSKILSASVYRLPHIALSERARHESMRRVDQRETQQWGCVALSFPLSHCQCRILGTGHPPPWLQMHQTSRRLGRKPLASCSLEMAVPFAVQRVSTPTGAARQKPRWRAIQEGVCHGADACVNVSLESRGEGWIITHLLSRQYYAKAPTHCRRGISCQIPRERFNGRATQVEDVVRPLWKGLCRRRWSRRRLARLYGAVYVRVRTWKIYKVRAAFLQKVLYYAKVLDHESVRSG